MQSKSISHKVLAVLSVLFAQVFVDVHAMIFALDVEIRLKNDVASTTTTATTTTILHVRVPLKESTDTTVDSPYYGRLPKFERMEAKTLLNKIRDLYGTERKTDESLPELPDVSHLALTLVTPGNDLGREFEPSDDVSVSIMEIGTYGHQSRLAVIDKRDQKPERIRRVVDESQLQQNQIVAGGIGTEDHFVVVQMTHEKVVCFRPQSGLISFLRSSLMKSDERLFKHQGRRSSSSSSSSSNANKKKQGLDPFSIRLRLSELSRHSHKIIAIVQKNTCAADADAGQEESDQTENKHSNNPESNDVDTFIGQAQTEGEAQDGSGPSWYQLESDVRLSLASLARFFQDELDTIHSQWQEILDSGSVSFDSLAVFLGEGSEVVTESADGFLQGGRVTDIEYIAMNARQGGFLASWTITVQTVTSNGINFGPLSTKIQIADFSPKLIPIKELGIRPISADERRFLTERGKLYRNLAIGAHHKSYMGPILLPRDHRTKEPSRTVRADGRIMVDIEHFHIQQTGNVPTLNSRHLLMYERQHSRADQSSAFQDQNKGENMQRESDSALNDSDLWTTPPSIPAFSFRQHRFGICHIELMSDIVWRTEAWNQLVLPEVKKELIRALILQTRSQAEVDRLERRRWKETSLMNTTSSTHGQISEDAKETDKELSNEMDIVQGKGGGCTMLLHGKSGTGKTLTAEAVSELLKRPLYAVTVGELGTTPAAVEKQLTNILDLASCWNATILLDEADVFLTQRGDDIERNGLVSIFLRTIEYFNGVLILTSNLADKLDEAFSSRIHVSLRYNELGTMERSKVWRNFLRDLPGEFDFAQLGEKFPLNGRQIRSAVRVAQALARDKRQPLSQRMIEDVVNHTMDD